MGANHPPVSAPSGQDRHPPRPDPQPTLLSLMLSLLMVQALSLHKGLSPLPLPPLQALAPLTSKPVHLELRGQGGQLGLNREERETEVGALEVVCIHQKVDLFDHDATDMRARTDTQMPTRIAIFQA